MLRVVITVGALVILLSGACGLTVQGEVQPATAPKVREQRILELTQKVEQLEDEVANLEEENHALRTAETNSPAGQPTKDVFRFPGIGKPILLADENVLSIRVMQAPVSGSVIIRAVYANPTNRYLFRPHLTVELFDRHMALLGTVEDRWVVDTVEPGESYSYDVWTGLTIEAARGIASIRIKQDDRPLSVVERRVRNTP